jgi:MYXO-CTERM domain-containing protein
MDATTLTGILALSTVGYGEVVDGRPTALQRSIVVYTNYARVAPDEWRSDYGRGDCAPADFEGSEHAAREPLLFHDGLCEVAQLHSEDMEATGVMAHDSSDGTSWSDRVWPYYDGNAIGENVAWGYDGARDVVLSGWMCSSGHRANILSADFEHIGTGSAGAFSTQDFGAGAAYTARPVAMASHAPLTPGDRVTFQTTWSAAAAPASLRVETETDCVPLGLVAGTAERGAYEIEAAAGAGCQRYRVVWGAGGTLDAVPTTGAYQYGDGCAEWVPDASDACAEPSTDDTGEDGGGQGPVPDDTGEAGGGTGALDPADDPRDDSPGDDARGCSSGGAPGVGWAALALATALALRRRA